LRFVTLGSYDINIATFCQCIISIVPSDPICSKGGFLQSVEPIRYRHRILEERHAIVFVLSASAIKNFVIARTFFHVKILNFASIIALCGFNSLRSAIFKKVRTKPISQKTAELLISKETAGVA